MTRIPPSAPRLVLLTAGVGLVLGGLAVIQGVASDRPQTWGFGVAGLLQVAPSLVVAYRLREGLGNRGLDGERRALRITSHLLRFLAMGLAIACILAWTAGSPPSPGAGYFTVAGVALVSWGALWLGKRRFRTLHPSLGQDAARARTLAGLAGLLLAGGLLGLAFPWAGPAAGLAMAAWLFQEGRTLAKATTVSLVGCGGCGSCGCG